MKCVTLLLTVCILASACSAMTSGGAPPNTDPGAGRIQLETGTLKFCDGRNLLYLHGGDLEVLPTDTQCKSGNATTPAGDPKSGQVRLETNTLKFCDGKHLVYLHGGDVEISPNDSQCA